MHRFTSILLKCAVFSALFLSASLSAKPTEPEKVPVSYRESIRRLQPMDTTGLDLNVAGILKKYYDRTFGGPRSWEKVQSVRFDGLLHLPQGAARFVAFKKKPDYCKVVVFLGSGARFVMAYDGEVAWQLNTSIHDSEPNQMPENEARNFIRDATISGHLVYPMIEGKQLNMLGTEPIQGFPCYIIEQILPDGQRILSALGVGDLAEKQQTTINVVTGVEEEISFSDFREIEGIRFPFASVMKSGGELVHRVEMFDIQLNVGAMSWMFQMPSGSYIPGEAPSEININTDIFKKPEDVSTSTEGFGLEPTRQTAFPDLEESDVESILDDLGKAAF